MDVASAEYFRYGLVVFIILLASVSVHEWAHAFTADRLGDDLPRLQGRVTLNPLAHIDLFGTIIFPLVMIFLPMAMGGGVPLIFGWGRPVQISLPNPKTRMRDDLLITSAGPLSNLLIAILVAVFVGVMLRSCPDCVKANDLLSLVGIVIQINVFLFIFNLLPIPPLDGGHYLKYALGLSEEAFFNLSRWGFLILLVFINLPPFQWLLSRIMAFVYKWVMFFI